MEKKSIVETILTADDKTLDTILQKVKIDVFYFIRHKTKGKGIDIITDNFEEVQKFLMTSDWHKKITFRQLDYLQQFLALSDLYMMEINKLEQEKKYKNDLKISPVLRSIVEILINQEPIVRFKELCELLKDEHTPDEIKECLNKNKQYFDAQSKTEESEICDDTIYVINLKGKFLYNFIRQNEGNYSQFALDQASYKTAKIVQDFVEDLIDGKKNISDIENMKTDLPGDVEEVLQIDLRRIAEKLEAKRK